MLKTSVGLSGLMVLPGLIKAKAILQTDPEPYKIELVKEFVIAGHGNLPKVQSMLKDYPNIIFSKYDWGNGDFEAGIEGAGHVGNKEIAKFLIDEGARVTLFVLAMLGKTNLVKPILEEYPKLIFAMEPHGFTLLHHAKAGGEDAEARSENCTA